jgi:poly(3-hydroxyalkanoate) synthetase
MRRAALLAVLLSGCASARAYLAEPLPPEAELVFVRTSDGVDLPVVHYKPSGPAHPLPLVLCHGISGNARHMDLDADHSLARWFAARGYDAWSISLRGTWNAVLPAGAPTSKPEETSFDTYAEYDLPAVFDYIRQRTGAPQVDYVGHSMGGLVLYAYLARGGQAVHAAATLGAPARLRFGGGLEPFVRAHGGVVGSVESVPNDALAPLYVPVEGVQTPLDLLVMNPENVTLETWRKFVVTGTAPMAGGVLRQFQRCIADDHFESADGKIDYLRALHDVHVPILFVAGKLDRIALADGVKAAYTALGGEKRFFMAGAENGFEHDYNHIDMLIAERAPVELWPALLDWLDRHPPEAR